MSKKIAAKIGKIGGIVLLCLSAIILILIIAGNLLAPDYTKRKTAGGLPVNRSFYIDVDKDTKIFVSVWLPENLKAGEKIGSIIQTSRYSVQLEAGWLYKVMQTYLGAPDFGLARAGLLNDGGYAFIYVQSPGSCQSTGERSLEYPASEITVMRAVLDWMEKQPWSNGKAGAWGLSYSGTTSDTISATGHRALKAVIPAAPDFDIFQLVRPGGILNRSLVKTWSRLVLLMDNGDKSFAAPAEAGFLEAFVMKSMIKGLKKPDDEAGKKVLNRLLEERKKRSYTAEKAILDREYSDQLSPSFNEISVFNYKKEIEAAQVNTYTIVGWMDAGTVTTGALQKYVTFNTPQKLLIGPYGHNITNDFIDPYTGYRRFTKEETVDFNKRIISFFDAHLKEDAKKQERTIRYYTYGSNTWHETDVWPPAGTADRQLFFGEEYSLTDKKHVIEDGQDTYRVDFTATTGQTSRWNSQAGPGAHYPDRAEEDKKLLTYTSAPLEKDAVITGSPVVYLYVSSTHTDGAFHVYLEDVAPDGKVTYLSEGILRGTYRKVSPPEEAPYVPLGVYHSFRKKDALPMVPGEVMEIALNLSPISVRFKKGSRIRIAIAGYDDSIGSRYPASGNPLITVERNKKYPSRVILPVELGR